MNTDYCLKYNRKRKLIWWWHQNGAWLCLMRWSRCWWRHPPINQRDVGFKCQFGFQSCLEYFCKRIVLNENCKEFSNFRIDNHLRWFDRLKYYGSYRQTDYGNNPTDRNYSKTTCLAWQLGWRSAWYDNTESLGCQHDYGYEH